MSFFYLCSCLYFTINQHKRNKFSQENLLKHLIFIKYEFVFIHPFHDGNGRTARLCQTAILSHWEKAFTYLHIERVGNTENKPNKKYRLAE